MKDFFFIDEDTEVQPEVEPKVEPTYSWCFPVVNGVRTAESQELINKVKKAKELTLAEF